MASNVPPDDGGVEQFRTETPVEATFPADGDPRSDRLSRALFDELSRAFRRRAEERYVRRLTPEHLRRSIGDLLGFILMRVPGETLVRCVVPAQAGWDPNEDLVAIETCMDDQPFIIDTLKLAFSQLGLSVVHSVTLLLPTRRDADGRLATLEALEGDAHVESVTRWMLARAKEPALRDRIVADVKRRLDAARAAGTSFLRLKKLCREVVNEYEYVAQLKPQKAQTFRDAAAFVAWLVDNAFVFFGASFYRGAHRHGFGAVGALDPEDAAAHERFFGTDRDRDGDEDIIHVHRSATDAIFHRAGRTYDVMLRRFDDAGRPSGGLVIHGLLTQKGSSVDGANVPWINRRLEAILRDEEAVPESHTFRALRKAFDALPIEFLLEVPPTGLRELCAAAARADTDEGAIVHVVPDSANRRVFSYVIVSQDVFTDDLREALQAALIDGTRAAYSDHRVSVGFGRAIGLYFYLAGCDATRISPDELEAKLLALCTPWSEQLTRALRLAHDEDTAHRLHETFGNALPEAYQRLTSPDRAVKDVELLDRALRSGQTKFEFFQEPGDQAARAVRLRLFHKDELLLSDVLPVLDHFGFRVIDQDGIPVTLTNSTKMAIDTFRILAEEDADAILEGRRSLVEGLQAVFRGDFQSDPLNRLMVRGLAWEQVDMLRAYVGYALQIRPTFAREALFRVLAQRADVTRAIVELFAACFAPDESPRADPAARAARIADARAKVDERLKLVVDGTEDKVLRTFVNLVDATVRTNFYRRDGKSHYLSFKIDCARLEVCPEPRPKFEIYVHAAAVEGVHLRGGRIARGGIRWSDRLDDYRTEIFGLMRTQMVKNVLIVPVGAKGGFVMKSEKPGIDRRAFADKIYETFIRGLLDVTDNIVDNKPVHPAGVICHDEPDPYLVVAADKGTAHLSDTANRIAEEYGYWLGDAFASGGSAGYDHKVFGITARGAWECARHHFSFLGKDPERDVLRVVGIGDMSGDVFGNGMLLSRTMKLVGAFDHRHVFLDPDPDPEASFLERQRLFRLPRSSWGDYRKEVLSKGGGAFKRSEKEVPLSPECQRLLGVDEPRLPPDAVIKRLLTLDVDLLWNGGIGTYVKASEEENARVGDRVNDALRVDAKDLSAKVFAEGGNLGITQRGRVEYALRGGRINTDAIDNSAGVDTSDHEVNLKILLAPLVAHEVLKVAERDKLLREIADDVCKKVIRNNTSHSVLLTLDELRGKNDPYAFQRVVEFLDGVGAGIPKGEQIPSAHELASRGVAYFVRPEHAKIAPYVKAYVAEELLRSNPLRFPDNDRLLDDYFPEAIRARYQAGIERHLLLPELLATIRTNEIMTYTGSTFFPDLAAETDRSVADIAVAYTIANHWLGAYTLRESIDAAADVRAEAKYAAFIAIEDGLREATSWLLHFLPGDLLWKRAALIGRRARAGKDIAPRSKQPNRLEYGSALFALREHLPSAAPAAWRRAAQSEADLTALALPAALAQEVGLSNQWAKVFPIAELSDRTMRPTTDVAQAYLMLGQVTRLNALVLRVGRQTATDSWEALAVRGLRASLLGILFEFTSKVLVARMKPEEVLERYPEFLSVAQEIQRAHPSPERPVPVPVLVVVAEKLRKSLARVNLEPVGVRE
jgi:glutamate dehydrogenase